MKRLIAPVNLRKGRTRRRPPTSCFDLSVSGGRAASGWRARGPRGDQAESGQASAVGSSCTRCSLGLTRRGSREHYLNPQQRLYYIFPPHTITVACGEACAFNVAPPWCSYSYCAVICYHLLCRQRSPVGGSPVGDFFVTELWHRGLPPHIGSLGPRTRLPALAPDFHRSSVWLARVVRYSLIPTFPRAAVLPTFLALL